MANDTYGHETQTKRRSGSGCLKGCLIAFIILVIIGLLGAWWVSRNWRGMLSGIASSAFNQAIDESQLPEAEKQEVKAEIERVTKGFTDGTITDQQMGQIMDGLLQSPLLPTVMVKGIESQYFDKSGLSAEEKAEGSVALQRFTNGMLTQKIGGAALDKVLAPIGDKQPDGEWKLREKVTDDELRQFIAAAKAEADAAGIPEEVPPFDPSEELKKIIDAALNSAPPASVPTEEVPVENELEPAAP